MTIINLVLSAHGYGDIHNSKPLEIKDNMLEEHTFTIPNNFYIMSYSEIDTKDCLLVSNQDPSRLCNSPYGWDVEGVGQIKVLPYYKNKARLYLSNDQYPNIALWSDEKKTFNSNVIDCETGNIIYDIDILPNKYIWTSGIKYKLTLRELIYELQYILREYNDYIFCLHLLVCTNHVPELSQLITLMSGLEIGQRGISRRSSGISRRSSGISRRSSGISKNSRPTSRRSYSYLVQKLNKEKKRIKEEKRKKREKANK